MTVPPQELLATPIIIPHRADGLPRALPGVRVGVGRDRQQGWAQRPARSGAPLLFSCSGPSQAGVPFSLHGMGAQLRRCTGPVSQGHPVQGAGPGLRMPLDFILCYTLLPMGVHCSLALPRQLQVLRWLVPRATLPLRFPGAGNQSCSVVFLPKKQCPRGPECFHVWKEGKRSNIY